MQQLKKINDREPDKDFQIREPSKYLLNVGLLQIIQIICRGIFNRILKLIGLKTLKKHTHILMHIDIHRDHSQGKKRNTNRYLVIFHY